MSEDKSDRDAIHDVLEEALQRIGPKGVERGLTASVVVSFLLASAFGGLTIWQHFHTPEIHVETLDARIQKLTKSLLDASDKISGIEQEIEARQELARKLKDDAEQAQRLKDLNAAQVAAVAQTVRGQIEASNDAGWWKSVALNLFFACFGAFLSELIRILRERWRASPLAKPRA